MRLERTKEESGNEEVVDLVKGFDILIDGASADVISSALLTLWVRVFLNLKVSPEEFDICSDKLKTHYREIYKTHENNGDFGSAREPS